MSEATCVEAQASCVCANTEGHDGPHECGCGGSWAYVDGEFVIHEWPAYF
jgi:hypothetical protein